jgi:hypothetical protein
VPPSRNSADVEQAERRCLLRAAVGQVEICPGASCLFWEEGGAALPGGCLLERLDVDLRGDPAHAAELLALRERLKTLGEEEHARELRVLLERLRPNLQHDDE